jgi:hypothetical protein
MSLTALVQQKLPEIRFIEWFRREHSSGNSPLAPLVTMTRSQFERVELDFVPSHFQNYEKVILDSKEFNASLEPQCEKVRLTKHVPLKIHRHHETGNLEIVPLKFKRYDLGGFVALDRDLFPTASLNLDCSSEEFVRSSDMVAAEAG